MAVIPSSVSLSAPYLIFPLSQPLHQTRAKDREGGTYRTCFTSPIESTKKRKRGSPPEIAVAVDGEGVNIYDVRATQIVSTYALPPTTKFSCSPVSSFSRAGKSAAAFSRRTYAAVSMPKKQLLCWEEQGVSSDDDKAEAINMLSCSADSRHDVVYLKDLASGRKRAEGGLIAAYTDGYIRCFSSDLKDQKWEFLSQSLGAAKKVVVVFAASTTLASAKKALLKDRLDIVLPETVSMEEEAPEDMILFTVSRNGSIFEARVFSIPTSGDEKIPRELLVLPLPGTADEALSAFSVHFPTATLNLLSTENLTTFSLSTTTPTILSSLHIASSSTDDPTPSSLLRISSSTVLVATNEDVSLYDTKFTSLQARVSIQPSTSTNTPATSRASTPASTVKGGISLTAYLPDLDLAIGYSQNGIAAIQISRAGLKGDARKSGLLIDSLCRGVGADTPQNVSEKRTAAAKEVVLKLAAEKVKMEAALVKLKSAKEGLDLEAFEVAFAEYVGIKRNTQDTDVAMSNGTVSKALSEFYTKTAHKPLPHEFVTTVLDLIFEKSTGSETGLRITFYPPNVIKYLAESGNLSRPLPGIVDALSTYDPTLRTLEWALSIISELNITEVISAVHTALSHSPSDLAATVIRSEVLRLALIRLDTFPGPAIITAFKSRLSSGDLNTLISLLRTELSLHDDVASVSVGINDMGISSSLLTAALDTLGVSGVVLRDGAETFVTSFHDEVAEAVEAVEEAAGLKAILEEVFRHAEWSGKKAEKKKGKKKKRVEVRGRVPGGLETPKKAAPASPSKQLLKSAKKAQRGKELAARKVRLARSSKNAREMAMKRLESRRRPRLTVGKGVGALLPLGMAPVAAVVERMMRGELPAEVGGREVERKKGREDALRRSLVAGVYSVESMVV